MAIIPDVNVDQLRPDFKDRINIDKTDPPCIWYKAGRKMRRHLLLDCPNAFPLPEQRTPFSNQVFGAGHGDAAVVYIHQLQRAHDPRQDGLTPFNSGRLRYQISNIRDVLAPSTVASASTAPTVATADPLVAAGSTPLVNAPAATVPAISADTTTALGGSNITSSAGVPPTANTTANVVPSTSAAGSTGPAIPIAYEDENVQPLQAQNAPVVHEMLRGGLIIKPKPNTTQKLSALHAAKTEFHTRESFVDAKERVYTNHSQLTIRPDQKLYKYKVESTLLGNDRRKVRALMQTVMGSYDFLRDNAAFFATNHLETIIAWKPLHTSIGPQHLQLHGDNQSTGSIWRLRPDLLDGLAAIGITFIFEGMVDFSSLLKHTDIDPAYASTDLEPTKRALNIIISKCFGEATTDMIQVGPNKFFSKRGTHILSVTTPNRTRQNSVSLCTMRRYYYTVKAGVRNVLLNINPCTSAFFNSIKVSEVMQDTLTFKQWEQEGVLRGLRVHIELLCGDKNDLAAYTRLNTPQARVRTIQGLGLPLQEQEFDDADGVRHNVFTHLQNTYPNRTIHRPDLPAVNLGSSFDPKWYAPEDLLVIPYQMFKSVVPTALTESMLETACLKPEEGAARVDTEALKALGIFPTQNDARPLSKCSALTLNPHILLVPSHQFDFPKIQYGNQAVAISGSGSWNLIGKTFYRTVKPIFKTLLLVDNSVHRNIRNMAKENFQIFASKKYNVATINFVGIHILNNLRNPVAMEDIVQRIKPDLVLLVLESRDVEAYSRFKDLADRTFGCHSICMTGRIFDKGISSKMGNIMMKANLKAAGSNHTISQGTLTEIMAETLVLGADVTHPNGGSITGCPSISAIVGSVDNHAGRFLGSMRLQSVGKKEMVDYLENMVVKRIKDWVINNQFHLPKNIIYYRGGVSEGQYKAVRDEELSKIMSAFPRAMQELSQEHHGKHFNGEAPKLTAIVCAKRHHVRFYPENRATRNGNCQPGTYVDDVVTSPYYTDFYLQSHSPLQGTARPAHYFVLRNEMNRSVEELRQLTHELCFTYVRTTGAVSYASPAYYADRLCERGRCYLGDFFVTTQEGKSPRQELKSFKRDEEGRRAARRAATYGPSWNGNTRGSKELAEQAEERKHRRAVDEACCSNMMDKAKKVSYKNGAHKNPWKASIAHTMFWM